MTKALVLGGGGVAGIAWESGIVTGLRRAGIDLGEADLIIGTSAGSVVGTLMATGVDLESSVATQAETELARETPEVDMGPVMAAFAILFDASIEPKEARRRVGAIALTVKDGAARLETVGDRLPVKEWPERRLLVTAVDAGTGEFVVWDRDSGASLTAAVASSCAVPGVFPPVEINGGHYMDGGVRSATNADLAKGSAVTVIIEPMANLSPRARFTAETAQLERVAHVAPDAAALAVFGDNVLDPALWAPAFEAGLKQAPSVADAVREVW